MEISNLTDQQIKTMIMNYDAAGKAEGGLFSLANLLKEQALRSRSDWDVRAVVSKILELSRSSLDGKLSYKALWEHFCPDQPWIGHGSLKVVGKSLGKVIGYCATHKLPVLTVLVVRQGERRLSPDAVQNIFDESKRYGIDVGYDPQAFVKQQEEKARALRDADLP